MRNNNNAYRGKERNTAPPHAFFLSPNSHRGRGPRGNC